MNGKDFKPDWTEQAPPPDSYRSIFKLGKPDEFKHPRDGLGRMIQEEFGMTDDDFRLKQNEGNEKVVLDKKPRLSGEQINKFRELAGEENVSLDDYDRVKYSCGQMLREVMDLRLNKLRDVTDLVVHPRDKNDVRKLVEYCN